MDQSEPSGDPRTSTAVVPSVVAVVVTHDPGAWFEEALTSLAEQDYRNLSILVVDAASDEDPTPRIAEVTPGAFVRRLRVNPGYGAAANEVLSVVEGASFYLLCHDDVALESSAVRLMVEEAYRSNAGVVGPKVAMWSDAERLLQVGQGGDQFGVPAAIAERGELDQEQHDAVRDVFSVPGGCQLIRADLFAALGGFDEAMTFHGEDVDLCWRAHIAGARVVVAPAARVRHLEALGERRPDDRRRLQARHRLRMVFTDYGAFYTVAIVPRQLLLSMVEVVVALVTGRFHHAGDVIAAYAWNLRNLGSIMGKRRQLRRIRQVNDLEIRRLQVGGSARLSAFARGRLAGRAAEPANLADTGRQLVSAVRRGFGQQNALIVGVIAVIVLFGSRHLVTQKVPVIGEFVPFPSSARDLVGQWWSGWREAGLGVQASPPTGLGLFGVLGIVLLGATGILRNVLIVGLLPLGAVGAWRLGRIGGPSRAPAVAVLAYLVNPLPYNALAGGSWRGLAAYAACPWILHRLALASGVAPFVPAGAGSDAGVNGPAPGTEPTAGGQEVASPAGRPRWRRPALRQVAGLGLVVALTTVVYPAMPVLVLIMVAGLAAGSALAWRWEGTGRVMLVGLAGTATAVALHFPWLIGGLDNHDPDLTFAGRTADVGGYRLVQALHFDVGPLGSSWLTWGLLVAALLPLAIGRGWRLAWAVRAWTVAAACWLVLAAQRADILHVKLPPPEVLLAPAAASLALAVALGVIAFEVDLPGYHFGWRQLASLAAAAALVLAALPVLAASFDGRWHMPRGGYDRTLRFQAEEARSGGGSFRVLWLGSPAVLPVAGWELPPDVAQGSYATTVGVPTAWNLWAGPQTGTTRLLPAALAEARAGNTSRLGQLLAPMGVRYVVVADQLAPAPFGGLRQPADQALDDLLARQLDLQEVGVNPSLRVFRNTAWMPVAVDLGSQSDVQDPLAVDPSAVGAAIEPSGVNGFSGDVQSATAVHLAEAFAPQWHLDTAGSDNAGEVVHDTSFGWANRFTVPEAGSVDVGYRVPGRRIGLALAQIALWLLVAFVALRQPEVGGRGRRRSRGGAEPVAPASPPILVTAAAATGSAPSVTERRLAQPASTGRTDDGRSAGDEPPGGHESTLGADVAVGEEPIVASDQPEADGEPLARDEPLAGDGPLADDGPRADGDPLAEPHQPVLERDEPSAGHERVSGSERTGHSDGRSDDAVEPTEAAGTDDPPAGADIAWDGAATASGRASHRRPAHDGGPGRRRR